MKSSRQVRGRSWQFCRPNVPTTIEVPAPSTKLQGLLGYSSGERNRNCPFVLCQNPRTLDTKHPRFSVSLECTALWMGVELSVPETLRNVGIFGETRPALSPSRVTQPRPAGSRLANGDSYGRGGEFGRNTVQRANPDMSS